MQIKKETIDLGRKQLQNCKLGLIQIHTPESALDRSLRLHSKQEILQLQKILKFIEQALERKCNIILLPEYCTSPAIVHAIVTGTGDLWEQLSSEEQGQYTGIAQALQECILIAGSYCREQDGKLYNTCPIVAFGEEYLQNKLYPTRVERNLQLHGGEQLYFFVNSGWGDFVVAICYDYMFQLYDKMLNVVDLFFVIARNPSTQRFENDYSIPRCRKLGLMVGVANEANFGRTALYAPYKHDLTVRTLGRLEEDLLVIDCPTVDMDRSRSGNPVEPFMGMPPDVHCRHIPQVKESARSYKVLNEEIQNLQLTINPEDIEDLTFDKVYLNTIITPKSHSNEVYPLEFSDYFSGDGYPKGHRVIDNQSWEKMLKEIKQCKAVIDKQGANRQLKVEASSRLAVAIAFGYVFSVPSGYKLLLYQWSNRVNHDETWCSFDAPANVDLDIEFCEYIPELTLYQKITGIFQPKTRELSVLVSISQKLTLAVEKYLGESHLNCHNLLKIMPKEGARQDAVKDSAEAIGIARTIRDKLVEIRGDYIFDKIHLFYCGPVSLAVFLGQHLNACGPIQIYEYQDPGYAFSFLLKS